MRTLFLFFPAMLLSGFCFSQLTIQAGGQLYIESGGVVAAQGDVISNANILGPGKLVLNGTALQKLSMNGFSIPNLEINNTNHVSLISVAHISNSLIFTNGKILTGNYILEISDVAAITGAGAGKFVEVTGTGELRKLISTNVSNYPLPLGYGSSYTPLSITTSGTYLNAYVGAGSKGTPSPQKPIRSTDFLNTYWSVKRSGITGTVTATALYNQPADITGNESDLRGFYWDGSNWSLSGASLNTGTNEITATILPAGGDIYAMNRFVYLSSKVFLQGAYTAGTTILGTPVMNNGLRTPVNLIPLSDPYRIAPYSSSFTHVNNTIPESAGASVFTNQPDARNDIVDWVFIELRNTASPGNTVLQTRSALLQRDGDVVDVDGINPLFFKNVDASNFTIAVRHRNHLGISADPVAFQKTLNEQTGTPLDFTTTSDAQLFGNAAAFNITNGIIMLWAGNANVNNTVSYSVLGNDRIYILNNLLGGNTLGSVAGYNEGDVNMNGIVNYSVLNNDRIFILNSVLGGITLSSKTQQLPN